MVKTLTDKEYKYFATSVKAFVKESCERFNISEEEAIRIIERELRLFSTKKK